MQRILWTLTFLLLTAVTCPAGQHPVRVTRTAGDFYAVFDQDLLIKTAFCSVRAFEERAALRAGELVFADGTRCTVDRVYARQRLRRGGHMMKGSPELFHRSCLLEQAGPTASLFGGNKKAR